MSRLAPLGWVLVILGIVVVRGATRGRGLTQTPADVSDLILAVVSGGDSQAVLERRGEPALSTAEAHSGSTIVSTARRLAQGATYRLGAAGPKQYDCSGLVWATLRDLGYTGARFDTATFPTTGGPFQRVGLARTGFEVPQVGDIVLWPRKGSTGHVGFMDADGSVFSALSPRSGIKSLPIASITRDRGYSPVYYRWAG